MVTQPKCCPFTDVVEANTWCNDKESRLEKVEEDVDIMGASIRANDKMLGEIRDTNNELKGGIKLLKYIVAFASFLYVVIKITEHFTPIAAVATSALGVK